MKENERMSGNGKYEKLLINLNKFNEYLKKGSRTEIILVIIENLFEQILNHYRN